MHDLSILAIIWVSVFFASFLAHKTSLTPVLWFLFFGAMCVNLGILPKEMPEFIVVFSELGIIFIMFALGFEEDTNNFLKSVKRCWGIALFGALAPFSVTYLLTYVFWGNNSVSLMCGLAMAATAVSLTLVSLKGEGLSNSVAATAIMSSAVLDSFTSLAFVAILVPVATGMSVTPAAIALILIKAALFFILVTIIGAWLFPKSKGWIQKLPFIGRFNLQKVLAMGEGQYTVLSLLLIGLSVGLLAHYLGFHAAVGAYMAGLVIRREYFNFSDDQSVDHYQQARDVVDNAAFSWIGPVFFVTLGCHLIFDTQMLIKTLPHALLLFAVIFVAQIVSAAGAARFTGSFPWPDSLMIGFGMLGRAELAFVVLDIAFVQAKIISIESFYTLMLTIFMLNCSVPLTIRWWKRKFLQQKSFGLDPKITLVD